MQIHAELDSQLASSFLITKFKTQDNKKFLTVCSGSVTFGKGPNPWHWITDPDPDPALFFFYYFLGGFFLFSLVAFKMQKKIFLRFLLKGTFKPIFKFKQVISKSQNCRNQVFPIFFLHVDEGFGTLV